MTARMMRRGAAALSAVAIVAGGAMVGGAGTAAAQFYNPLNPLLQLEADIFNSLGSSDRVGCPSSEYHSDRRTVGDVTFARGVNTPGYRGSYYSVQYYIRSDDNSEFIHRITDYPPSADYRLKSLRIQWFDVVDGVQYRRSDDHPLFDVDRQTGAVTITGAYPITTDFVFTYEGVPSSAREGSVQQSGGGFTAAGMEPQDWPVMEGSSFEVGKSPLTCGPNYNPGMG